MTLVSNNKQTELTEFVAYPISTPTAEPASETVIEMGTLETANRKPITAWENFTQNWAWIQGDDDEEEVESVAKEATLKNEVTTKKVSKFEPMGPKQYAALGVAMTYIVALAIIFRDEPIVAASITAGVMHTVKRPYGHMEGTEKTVMRFIAFITLVAALALVFIPNTDNNIALAILCAIPFADFAMAVFVKGDFTKLKVEKHVVDLFKKVGLAVSKKSAKIAMNVIQAVAFGVLMNPRLLGPFIAAGCAVLNKVHMRRLVDTLWERMKKIENPTHQNLALAGAYGTTTMGAGLSIYAMQQDPNAQSVQGFLALLVGIITVDTLIRTGKNMIKSYEIPEEFRPEKQPLTLKDRCTKTAQTGALLMGLGALAWGIGDKMVQAAAGNPGLVVYVCQETVTFLKTATKRTFRNNIAIPFVATVLLTLVAAGLHYFQQNVGINRNTPGYGAALFLIPCFIVLSLFLGKDYLVPPKKGKQPKVKEVKVEEVVDSEMGEKEPLLIKGKMTPSYS